MDKKRILLCNEASFLSTGFSTYGLEVMKRLHATGKYHLAEFASYAAPNDERQQGLPWKFYGNMWQNPEERKVYDSKPTNQFGEWKFESVLLAFQPDIVWDIRDWWMLEYQERSPFRNYFNWGIMPTVDAYPQDDQWLSTFMNADGVFSYSDWGLDVLKQQSNNKIKTIAAAPPGIDIGSYKVPIDKKTHRDTMGLDRDVFIIGTVMRNQRRKLYPDLIEAFAKFLKVGPTEITKKSYLYIHCAYPDIGWELPRLIKEAGIGNRTIFTYFCPPSEGGCGCVFPSFYQDIVGVCRKCGQAKAILPRTQLGISREALGQVIALFDAYVQYALSEGFGLPQIEAAACGVPVFAVDYSAMSDVVRKIKGYPIKVQRLFRESETHCFRALPDNDDLIRQLIDFLSLPESMRMKKGYEARKAVELHYNWDKTAKLWEDYFDRTICSPREQTWLSPAKLHTPAEQPPPNLSNEEFVRWGLIYIAGRPDLTNSYMAMRMVRDLNWGVYQEGMGGVYHNDASTLGIQMATRQFSRNEAAQVFYSMCQQQNFWEQERGKNV